MTLLNGEPVDASIPSTAPPRAGVSNPVGTVMAVLGLIFAFTFPPAGIVLGAIARSMARRDGDRNPPATVAIVVGIVLTVIGLLAAIAIIAFSVAMTTEAIRYCEQGIGDGTFLGLPVTCE